MKTAILVHGPDFACSENLTKAFSLWGETHLISIHPSDWRDYDPGLFVHDGETLIEAREVVERADLLFLGDSTSFCALAKVSPSTDWINWAREKEIVAFFGDSSYYRHPQYFDGLCQAIWVKCLFLLPNLIPFCSLNPVPLHHPMPLYKSKKAETLTVMHAPGRNAKAIQKGTNDIEDVIRELKGNGVEFEYRRLMRLTLKECLKVKATAHIVIDQMPPEGKPAGLGKTGLEALAAGSAVLTKMYDTNLLKGYFDRPPVMAIRDKDDLQDALYCLLTDGNKLKEMQATAVEWAAKTTAFKPWLAYIERWI